MSSIQQEVCSNIAAMLLKCLFSLNGNDRRRDLLFRDTAFAAFRGEPVGWLRGVLGDTRDAGTVTSDELPDTSGQEQSKA